MHDFYLKLKQEPAFAYGEKLYTVSVDKSTYITEKCPVCDDTGQVEIKGHLCRCPLCQDPYKNRNGLKLYHYEVTEYIINEIHVRGPEVKNAYEGGRTDKESNLPVATFYGFTKSGNSLDSVTRKQFSSYELFEDLDDFNLNHRSGTRNRRLAEEACAKAHAKEKEELAEFNREFGTAHPWPWKD